MRILSCLLLVLAASACGGGDGNNPFNEDPDAAPAGELLNSSADGTTMCALGWNFLDADNEGSSIVVEGDCGQVIEAHFSPVPPVGEQGFCSELKAWVTSPKTGIPDSACGTTITAPKAQGSLTVVDAAGGLRVQGGCACPDDNGPDITISFDLILD